MIKYQKAKQNIDMILEIDSSEQEKLFSKCKSSRRCLSYAIIICMMQKHYICYRLQSIVICQADRYNRVKG